MAARYRHTCDGKCSRSLSYSLSLSLSLAVSPTWHCCTPTVLVICLVFTVLWRSLTVCSSHNGVHALICFHTSQPHRTCRPIHSCSSSVWPHERRLSTHCFNLRRPGSCNGGVGGLGGQGRGFPCCRGNLGHALSESEGEERLLFLPAFALCCSLLLVKTNS